MPGSVVLPIRFILRKRKRYTCHVMFLMPVLVVLLIRLNYPQKKKEIYMPCFPADYAVVNTGSCSFMLWCFFCCYFWQVAQVLLTLPYSFSQLGMASGVSFQIFYGLLGSWTAYLISCLYVEYRSRKEKENVSFKNHIIQVQINQIHSPDSSYLSVCIQQINACINSDFSSSQL